MNKEQIIKAYREEIIDTISITSFAPISMENLEVIADKLEPILSEAIDKTREATLEELDYNITCTNCGAGNRRKK